MCLLVNNTCVTVNPVISYTRETWAVLSTSNVGLFLQLIDISVLRLVPMSIKCRISLTLLRNVIFFLVYVKIMYLNISRNHLHNTVIACVSLTSECLFYITGGYAKWRDNWQWIRYTNTERSSLYLKLQKNGIWLSFHFHLEYIWM